jgi:hypothetical protein
LGQDFSGIARCREVLQATHCRGLPRATISNDDFMQLTAVTAANDWARAIATVATASSSSETCVGLNMDWNQDEKHHAVARTLQLAFPSEITTQAVVIKLDKMGACTKQAFPRELKRLLKLPKLVPCGVSIGCNVTWLQQLGVRFHQALEELDSRCDWTDVLQSILTR